MRLLRPATPRQQLVKPPIPLSQARGFEGNPLELSYFLLSNLPVDDDVRQQLLEAKTGGCVCGRSELVVGRERADVAGPRQTFALPHQHQD